MNSILRRSSRSTTLLLLQHHLQSSSSSSRFTPTFNQQNQFFSTFLLGNRVSSKLNPNYSVSKEKSILNQFRFLASSSSYFAASDSINLDATERLKQVIEEELESVEAMAEVDRHSNQGDDTLELLLDPEECPFEVVDNPGEQTIILKRMFGDNESIQIDVAMPGGEDDLDGDNEDSDDVDEDGHDGKGEHEFSIPMKVTISKGDGPSLELCCFGIPDDIDIYSISLTRPEFSPNQIPYKGPEFLDLDENLQASFGEYLEMRGIDGSLANYLHKYMMKKQGKEYKEWLKSMKEFVES
ncbi:hypothetical protein C5167_011139 [Papaver somniferum]|uniref:Mitochondrial glycoprotein n=1 Tax=Papaver somniferum TaxID=3469 RepID=A0A4Y7K3G2_PAPSO|nr:uncharacterized protein At2g39795, mitochondrial-like [Papaver somniferum]RZC67457.1 hypothetical protein C5167_011139 [Papaver somniferum]